MNEFENASEAVGSTVWLGTGSESLGWVRLPHNICQNFVRFGGVKFTFKPKKGSIGFVTLTGVV